VIPAYLVLLRVGFTLPSPLLATRCALTAPFHPYLKPLSDLPKQTTNLRRFILCCTCRPAAFKRPSRTLSGTLPCGVRTFLPRSTPRGPSGSDHPAACTLSVPYRGNKSLLGRVQNLRQTHCAWAGVYTPLLTFRWPSRWSGSVFSRPTKGRVQLIPPGPVHRSRSDRSPRSRPVPQDNDS
jgi:hypothetical protein